MLGVGSLYRDVRSGESLFCAHFRSSNREFKFMFMFFLIFLSFVLCCWVTESCCAHANLFLSLQSGHRTKEGKIDLFCCASIPVDLAPF